MIIEEYNVCPKCRENKLQKAREEYDIYNKIYKNNRADVSVSEETKKQIRDKLADCMWIMRGKDKHPETMLENINTSICESVQGDYVFEINYKCKCEVCGFSLYFKDFQNISLKGDQK